MKRQNTSLIMKAIILLLALIIMVFTGSLAWFSHIRTVTADGVSVKTKTTQDFKMAVGFKNNQTEGKGDDGYVVSEFTKHFELANVEIKDGNISTFYNVFENRHPVDLTGDGITLVRPVLTSDNSSIETGEPHPEYVGVANEHYIAYDLFFQSSEECQIVLDKKTKVLGLVEQQGGNLVGDDSTISSDAIVGALRVAFTDYSVDNDGNQNMNYNLINSDDTLRKTNDLDADGKYIFDNPRTAPNALWIPRADIRFDDSDKPILYTGITNEMSEHASYTVDGENMNTFRHTFYVYDDDQSGYKEYDDRITSTITGLEEENVVICNVTHEGKDSEGNKCYYGKVHVKIWIEGCDSEARRVMNSGQFIIDMELLSKEMP